MTIVIYNGKSDGNSIHILVNEIHESSNLNGDLNVKNFGQLRDVQLQSDETWAYVYPNEEFGIGNSIDPAASEVAEVLRRRPELQIEQISLPENTQVPEIKARVEQKLNKFSSSI